ncbi:translation initiation factor IF-2 N-terminal domain-containing protein [Nocardia asteroides]|uniref:translation initiation factor IF-2 N-terminal domain-containing protein n=1 Tax=Nocardia asteroides TaxID=1824 RepID=UPI001E4210C2|nr:translation initiation factor IF-2 N-terminal domain-containing protein [Nocardia asteroides]UGT54104.1 translation initiation factor IF-2 N-terminal domain-containing protein [Nocardia asteroides]
MADTEPLDTTQQDADQLPERIRVHALAKRLGVTSKRILAKLAELGAEARSVQSNVDRAVAETVRDAIAAADAETGESPASTPVTAAPPSPAPVAEQPADPTTAPAPMFSASEVASTEGVFATEAPHTDLFTHRAAEPAAPAEPVAFEAPAVAAPLFLPPDATAAEEARKRRRAERTSKRTEEPVEDVEPETEPETAEDESDSAGDNDADGQPRRRRRGRRGRGRGRGEQSADGEDTDTEGAESDTDDEPTASTEAATDEAEQAEDTDSDDEDDTQPEGASRRRRRRRRRKVGGESGEDASSEDDPPNTVVHEREPRNKSRGRSGSDEVQGISGSTRLEAKRQRRRDGREAGRRRPPILTESEFLARREAVDRVMVVREKAFDAAEHAGHQTTTQVAVLEDNILVEHFVTSSGQASMVGNVYLGKVQNVLPSMEAAFIDIGRGRNGVLYAGEVNWEAAGLGGKERKIEQALKPGDQVLVQVSKDPVGHKGARLTTQISLAGRFLVYVPGGTSTGISRKLPDTERKRLKEILREIVPADAGVIIRTASEGVSEPELARDVERLQATWRTIEEAAKGSAKDAPKALYEEPDLLVKVIRDLFNEDFSRLVIEGDRAWSTVETYVRTVAPDLLPRVDRHENNGVDVFTAFRIDEQLAKALDRKVWLPSGGTLVIDRTEAMTVVDVNTGKFTGSGSSNLEETVTRNNLEAAEEIVRQMRLRDIGGMIVVDFIDMVLESNRDLVLRRLTEALGRDRTRHQVSEVTSLGLVQMTRKKLGTGLVEAFSTTCEHCHGRGILVHSYPVDAGSGADEQAGRAKEGGSRRRRGKDKSGQDKPAAAAPATNGTAPAEHGEEDIAVKRAHPVALAMAAHHGEEGVEQAVEAVEPEVVETAAVEEAPAEPTRSRSRSRSRRASRAAAQAEAPVESPALTGVITAEDESAEAEPEEVAVEAVAEPQPVAEPEQAAEPEPVVEPEPEQAPEPAPVAEEPARAPRRRRVARSTAAPKADSAGAVFVLSASEQPPAAAVVDVAAEPVVVPERKPRRRAVGRPAGAPAAEGN